MPGIPPGGPGNGEMGGRFPGAGFFGKSVGASVEIRHVIEDKYRVTFAADRIGMHAATVYVVEEGVPLPLGELPPPGGGPAAGTMTPPAAAGGGNGAGAAGAPTGAGKWPGPGGPTCTTNGVARGGSPRSRAAWNARPSITCCGGSARNL